MLHIRHSIPQRSNPNGTIEAVVGSTRKTVARNVKEEKLRYVIVILLQQLFQYYLLTISNCSATRKSQNVGIVFIWERNALMKKSRRKRVHARPKMNMLTRKGWRI